MGKCPKCSTEWEISEMIANDFQCPSCHHQLKHGSTIGVCSETSNVLTPCTPERAQQEVEYGRAAWIADDMIQLLYSPEKKQDYRDTVFKRDRGICVWCGGTAETLDHIIPNSKGGILLPINLMCACIGCNQQRGNRDVPEYLEWLAQENKLPPDSDSILELYYKAREHAIR